MTRESIKLILMRRDGMTLEEADDLIAEARENFDERVDEGDIFAMDDFCEDWFGLEPDYLDEFL